LVRIVFVLAVALATVLPAGAATVDPTALVLNGSDVPAGFRLDADDSGLRTNELEAKEYPDTRPLFRRWGRVTGYKVAFDRGAAKIEARADLFRDAQGARRLLDWVDREYQKSGIRGLKREQPRIGDESFLYRAGDASVFTVVLWRSSRVWAGVVGVGLRKGQVLDLARTQQRRIAAVLG
jgi:hypothetical protein